VFVQDFTAFSEEAFDAKAWINGALAAPRAQGVNFDVGWWYPTKFSELTGGQTHASMLLMKLQTFVQVC
jgi:hypothetical protein